MIWVGILVGSDVFRLQQMIRHLRVLLDNRISEISIAQLLRCGNPLAMVTSFPMALQGGEDSARSCWGASVRWIAATFWLIDVSIAVAGWASLACELAGATAYSAWLRLGLADAHLELLQVADSARSSALSCAFNHPNCSMSHSACQDHNRASHAQRALQA